MEEASNRVNASQQEMWIHKKEFPKHNLCKEGGEEGGSGERIFGKIPPHVFSSTLFVPTSLLYLSSSLTRWRKQRVDSIAIRDVDPIHKTTIAFGKKGFLTHKYP